MSIYSYLKAKVANPRRTSDFGQRLLHQLEGYSAEAYPDPGTGARPYTIGFGTTRIRGKPVELGTKISLEEAELYFREDLEEFEKAVSKAVKVSLTQDQFDALVSFTYNVGIGAFYNSTLLRKLNKGNYMGAANEFPRWNKAGGRVMKGLERRREIERSLFLSDLVSPIL